MSIESIEIKGFRSLRHVAWKPGSLNVVIGANGSGKSNLLRALDLLQQSASGSLSKAIIRQGGINAILWDGRAPEMMWILTSRPVIAFNEELLPRRTTGSLYTYAIRLEKGHLLLGSDYRVSSEMLEFQSLQGELRKVLERNDGSAASFDFQSKELKAIEGSIPADQSLLSLIAKPLSNIPTWVFAQYLQSWTIYHDLQTHQGTPVRQASIARFEKILSPDGQNLIPVLHTLYSERRFEEQLNRSMRAAFGRDFEKLIFPPAADQRVQLRIRWRSLRREQSTADLSDGTLRFLMLIAILANPAPGGLIAIDEPETGLHPSMFPIVAELATAAAERTTVILSTHSPQFLDAFTGETVPTTTVAEWVDGETKLSVLDGDELRRWLKEYTLGALFKSGELEGMA